MTEHEWHTLDVSDRVRWLAAPAVRDDDLGLASLDAALLVAVLAPVVAGTVLSVGPRSILIEWDDGQREFYQRHHRWMLERALEPTEHVP